MRTIVTPPYDPSQLCALEIAANTMKTWRRDILEYELVLILLFLLFRSCLSLRSLTVQSVGETTSDYARGPEDIALERPQYDHRRILGMNWHQ